MSKSFQETGKVLKKIKKKEFDDDFIDDDPILDQLSTKKKIIKEVINERKQKDQFSKADRQIDND